MSEQPTTCMCGHPQADHEDSIGWCTGPTRCGCRAYRRRDPITWAEMVEQITRLNNAIGNAYEAMVTSVLHDHANTPNEAIMAGFQEAARRLRELRADLVALTGHVAESPVPARPLKAVLAEIEAEGHQWTLSGGRASGAAIDTYVKGLGGEPDSEFDTVYGADPVQIAEERLAQIRELHAAKAAAAITEHVAAWTADEAAGSTFIHVTANVQIADGQEGRYVVGRIEDDELPWWVVDRAPNAAPVSLFSFPTEEPARQMRDAMNAGDIEAADRIIAAETRRREQAASEEEG